MKLQAISRTSRREKGLLTKKSVLSKYQESVSIYLSTSPSMSISLSMSSSLPLSFLAYFPLFTPLMVSYRYVSFETCPNLLKILGSDSGFPSFSGVSNHTMPPIGICPWSSIRRYQTESQVPQPSLDTEIMSISAENHPAGTREGWWL